MVVSRLWRPGAMRGLRGQGVALENNDLSKVVGEGPRGRKPSHARTDHDGPLADQS
jgi:hypothetical protein